MGTQWIEADDVPFEFFSTAFDGTNDYLARGADLTGISDGKTGLISAWIRMNASSDDNTVYTLMWGGINNRFRFIRDGGGRPSIQALNASGSTILFMRGSSVDSITKASGWHQILASWDLAQTDKSFIILDGVDITNRITHTNDTIDYTNGNFAVGAEENGANKFFGLKTQTYFDTVFRDVTTSAVQDLFSSGGKPISPPLPALVYLPKRFDAFEENAGTGGDFVEFGTLGDGGSDIP